MQVGIYIRGLKLKANETNGFLFLFPAPFKDVLNILPLERPLKSQMAYEFQEGGDAQRVAPKYSSDLYIPKGSYLLFQTKNPK